MKPLFLVVALLAGFCTPTNAADLGPRAAGVQTQMWRVGAPHGVLPFARGERAQSVWASGACWSECGAYCAWGQTQCLDRDAQGQCLKLTDKCDRFCQRECRTSGGPLLPVELPWD